MAGRSRSLLHSPRRGRLFTTSIVRADMSITDTALRRDKSWRLWGALGVLAVLFLGALLGFVVLPVVQGASAGIDPYTAICRALGVLPGSPARETPTSDTAAQPVTRVSWAME